MDRRLQPLKMHTFYELNGTYTRKLKPAFYRHGLRGYYHGLVDVDKQTKGDFLTANVR